MSVVGQRYLWLSCVLAAAVVKLVLVADHEIIAGPHPHDDYWQILSAAHWHWWRPYDVWTLMHLPVYPWFIGLGGAIGLPLRISIELLYLAGACALSASLGRLGLATPLRILALVLLVFHPYSFNTFDFARAGTLYACLLLFLVALFVRVIVPRSERELRWSAALFAGTTALVWHCRKESIIIGGLIGLMAAALVVAVLVGALTPRKALRLGVVLVAGPLGAALALGAVISAGNGLRYGLWHSDQMTATNYVRAYASLQAIRPDRPIRFVPMTRDARDKAYAVSPAFRELQPIIDGPRVPWYMAESKRWLGLTGEIGAGWYYWALVDAAAAAGHFKTARGAEAFFGRIADEVTAAVKEGRVASRRVLLSYVDPELSLWLPYVPSSFVRVARSLLPWNSPGLPGRPPEVPAEVVADFDAVARRRSKATREASYLAEGWALSSSTSPVRVEVIDGAGKPLRGTFETRARPDVPVMRDPAGRPGPPALGFTVEWATGQALESVRLRVVLEGTGSAVSGPIATIPMSHGYRLNAANAGDVVYIAFDRLKKPATAGDDRLTAAVIGWYPVVWSVVVIAAVVRMLLAVARVGTAPTPAATVVLLFVLAVIVSRLLFFAVLDASAWMANQMFYLFPVATLAAIVPVIVCGRGQRRLSPISPSAEGHRDRD